MQRISSLESPPKRISPRKTVLGARSFYSKQKPLYLTPLERKLLKETKPPPSEPSQPSSTAVKKPVRRVQKKSSVAGPQSNLKGYFTAKPKGKSPSDAQTDQPSKVTLAPVSFSTMKSKGKPKLVVGAAFFSSGKKPSSLYKKSAKTSKPKQPLTYEKPNSQKEKEVTSAPGERSPVRRAVFLKKHPEVVNHEDAESPKQMSPQVLAELHGITKDLKVILRRSVCSDKSFEAGWQVRLNSLSSHLLNVKPVFLKLKMFSRTLPQKLIQRLT